MKSIRGNARAKIVPKCSSVAVDPTLYGLKAKTGDAILKQMIIGAESRKKTRGRPLGQLNMGGGLYSPDPSPSNRQLNSPVTGVGFYKSSLKKLERQKYRLPVQNQFRNRIPVFEEAVPEHQFDPAGEPFRLERMRYFQSPRTPFQGDFLLMKPPPAKNIDSFGKRLLPVASAADTSLESLSAKRCPDFVEVRRRMPAAEENKRQAREEGEQRRNRGENRAAAPVLGWRN